MKLPNKFEFKVYNLDTYVMVKSNTDGEYYCYNTGEDTSKPTKAIHNSSIIIRAIKEGIWQITEDLDEGKSSEPELVFPFTYVHKDGSTKGTVNKVANKGLEFTSVGSDGEEDTCYNYWNEDEIKELLKDGTWIVKSVGEQPSITIRNNTVTNCVGPVAEPVKPLVIEIDSTCVDEAIHKMKMLAQAVENVNISVEAMQMLFREISPCGVGKGAVDVPDYSTFNLKGF